jgi:hypothetical protein
MPKPSESTFTELLQEAVDKGRVVIHVPTSSLPPLHRGELSLAVTLCALFNLNAREGWVLSRLMTNDYQTLEELCAETQTTKLIKPIKPKSAKVFLSYLRRKLAAHDIEIVNAHSVGYYLRKKSRQSIYQQLVQHDAESIPQRQPAQARASP